MADLLGRLADAEEALLGALEQAEGCTAALAASGAPSPAMHAQSAAYADALRRAYAGIAAAIVALARAKGAAAGPGEGAGGSGGP